MKKIFDVFIIFLLFLATTSSAQSGPYLGQNPPGPSPKLFVPNSLKSTSSWWWHGRLEFLSDGTEMFLDVYSQAEDKIRLRNIKLINGVWTAPASAPFSSPFSRDTDAAPSFFDNGNKVIFISDRVNGYSGNFWYSNRTGETWSNPQPVYVPWQQSLSRGWGMTISKDETIYTQLIDNNSNTDFDIYMIKKINGQYVQPERMSDNINSAYMDLGAFIDPDEQYIIFESNRPGTGGFSDLYISIKNSDGTWSESVNMGSNINTNFEEGSPYVSQDKKYFFFLSDRGGFRNPYWVDAKFISDMITDVKDNALVPNEVQLNQNYPNPFNPNTIIEYSIPKNESVSLKVYDIVGNVVEVLVNENQKTGYYQSQFNAKNLTSGVYFYQ